MIIKREWATPLVVGAFILSGITGLAMFFHLNTQLAGVAHEWLGLIFIIGGLSHITVNFPAFKRHLQQRLGRTIIIIYVAITILTFVPVGPQQGNGMRQFMDAAMQAPLSDLSRVLNKDPQKLLTQLQTAGYKIQSVDQSISSVTGDEPERRFQAMEVLMK